MIGYVSDFQAARMRLIFTLCFPLCRVIIRPCGLLALAALLLLQGCAPSPVRIEPGDPGLAWEQRRQQLEKIDTWRLKARIGIVAENDSGSASLFWEQHGDEYSLKIVGPFGRGSLIVEGSSGNVTMRTAEGETVAAVSPEELIWRQTGWIIPVSDLQYWILGLPANTHPREDYQLDAYGRIAQLDAGQWKVDYLRYQSAEPETGVELPDKIRLQNPRLSIKLAISEWILPK